MSAVLERAGRAGSISTLYGGVAGSEAALAAGAQADGLSNGANALYVNNRGNTFNETSWDRQRGNTNLTLFASAARTSTPTPYDGVNYNHRGLHLVIDATAAAATPSVVFTIQGLDVISGKYYTILASAAVTGISTTVLRVYPALTVAANLVASDILPRSWRLIATHGDADSLTYSVGASLIL